MPENDTQTLDVPVPEADITPAEVKKIEAEANQVPETDYYKKLASEIDKIANMPPFQKDTAKNKLKVLCKDITPNNISIADSVRKGRVLANALVAALQTKKPRVVKMTVNKAKLKGQGVDNEVNELERIVETNVETRNMLAAMGIHLHKTKISKGKKKKVTQAQWDNLKLLFGNETEKLFEKK